MKGLKGLPQPLPLVLPTGGYSESPRCKGNGAGGKDDRCYGKSLIFMGQKDWDMAVMDKIVLRI